jgi:hypothetical protein
MMLGRVMPEPPDFDLYTFMCRNCDFVKCVAVEMSTMQDNAPARFFPTRSPSAARLSAFDPHPISVPDHHAKAQARPRAGVRAVMPGD